MFGAGGVGGVIFGVLFILLAVATWAITSFETRDWYYTAGWADYCRYRFNHWPRHPIHSLRDILPDHMDYQAIRGLAGVAIATAAKRAGPPTPVPTGADSCRGRSLS